MTADLFAHSFGASQILGRCVLNVASPFSVVADDSTGSAEHLIARLDHAIVESGGTSLVIAREDSHVSGQLIPLPAARGRITRETQEKIWHEAREKIEETLRDRSVDLIHFHGVDFHHYLPESEIPKLITLHLPAGRYPMEIFTTTFSKNAFLHCVSQAQHRRCPNSEVMLAPITNETFVPEYLRRYEIIIRGCSTYAGAVT